VARLALIPNFIKSLLKHGKLNMSEEYRIETDSMGELKVPVNALYGAQTQRAVVNFPISGVTLPVTFIKAVALIKKTAAMVNQDLGLLDEEITNAIKIAAEEIMQDKHTEQFPVDVFQTGSGTSTNMNVNEVIARLASLSSGQEVNPNDHVNMGQSSNDVVPTAIHVSAALEIQSKLLPSLQLLQKTLENKAKELDGVTKTGRTHLMDAMPIRMSQELGAWAVQIRNGIQRIESTLPRILCLAQGGTAVGTGINAHPEFAARFAKQLESQTGMSFTPNDSFFESLSAQDAAVELSGQLKVIAVSLMKIANDLRWMNSGPFAGLGEIELTALQPGSSIMPGKVNPVIPEATAMVCAQVIGNDTTITVAGQSGSFQLNVMLPVIAFNLLQSIELLSNVSKVLAEKAIAGFNVRQDNLNVALGRNPILVTALNPIIGYAKAAEIAKAAYKQGRPVIDVAVDMTSLSRDELERLLDPAILTEGGIHGA
jgi:fumarate hydratase class II